MARDTDLKAALARIAEALGRPIRSFHEVDGDARPGAELAELLMLWEVVTDRQGRTRILNLARQEAARCGYGEQP